MTTKLAEATRKKIGECFIMSIPPGDETWAAIVVSRGRGKLTTKIRSSNDEERCNRLRTNPEIRE
jgi:hypothetical protein